IASNGGSGVSVAQGMANAILANSIVANTGLGIDLGGAGVTPNDPGDFDGGANNLQNFPELTDALVSNGTTTVVGTLDSAPNTTYRVEFFSSPTSDPAGFGEGATFLGAARIPTDAQGKASIRQALLVAVVLGQFLTATATDPANNTSEFSGSLLVGHNLVSIDDVTRAEGDAGSTTFLFTLTLQR